MIPSLSRNPYHETPPHHPLNHCVVIGGALRRVLVGQLQSVLTTLLAVTDEYDHALGDGNLEPFQRAIKDRLDSAYVAAEKVLRKSMAEMEPESPEADLAPHP